MVAPLLLLLAVAAASPPPASADAAEKAADPSNKMICKRFIETGSLVKGVRVCKTKAEWQVARDAVRSNMSSALQASCRIAEGGSCF